MKTTNKLSPTDIEKRFEEAARTLRRLPDHHPGKLKSAWPEFIQSIHTAYGYDPARIPRIAPSPQAISEMEECFEWLLWLDGEDARIVWMRAEGVRWRTISSRVGLDRTNAWRHWVNALIAIQTRINKGLSARNSKQNQKLQNAPAGKDGREMLI